MTGRKGGFPSAPQSVPEYLIDCVSVGARKGDFQKC